MTRSPRTPTLDFDTIDDVVAVLRQGGGRVSAARMMVLETLFAASGPVSAEHIATDEGRRRVALELTSVYRNLERLEELGVVRHVHLGHGPGLYALISGGEREYLVCESCDLVTTVAPHELDAVREQIRATFGYHAEFSHFPIVGLCGACDAAAQAGAIRAQRRPAPSAAR